MAKYYFENIDSEKCYSKDYFPKGSEVLEAILEKGTGMFYCKKYEDLGELGECGKECPDYISRNGKSGICKHHGLVYSHGEKVIINK